jgi:pentatricopeptide repeat protein
MLCRAAASLCLQLRPQQALSVSRLLSVGSKEPDEIKPAFSSDRARSSQRGGRSSNHESSARRTSPRHSIAEGDAIGRSQALTARIGQLGKQGRWQDVIKTLETAENNGQKLDVINFSTATTALTRSQQPERALQLSVLMHQRGLNPDVYAYTTFIDVYSKGERWQQALGILDEMQLKGVVPNVRSYTAAIDACSKGGQWLKAEQLLRRMISAGIKPDVKELFSYYRCLRPGWALAASN